MESQWATINDVGAAGAFAVSCGFGVSELAAEFEDDTDHPNPPDPDEERKTKTLFSGSSDGTGQQVRREVKIQKWLTGRMKLIKSKRSKVNPAVE